MQLRLDITRFSSASVTEFQTSLFFFSLALPRIAAIIVFGDILLFSTKNDSLRKVQSVRNVFIGNNVVRRKMIPTIHFGNIYFTPTKIKIA